VPEVPLESWLKAFQLLARLLPPGRTVLLLDEISWMATGEPDFAGYFKIGRDQLFSRREGLIVVLCGSVSSWIQETLVIHAECSTILKSLPWYIHLRPATTDYDRAMRLPGRRLAVPLQPWHLAHGPLAAKGNGRLVRHARRHEVSWVLAYLLRWEPVGKTTCLLALLMDHGVE